MDDDPRDLVNRLRARAGMIMEDVSARAVTLPANLENAAQAIERIERDVETIRRLTKAASELARADNV